jgi:hypothetical protein
MGFKTPIGDKVAYVKAQPQTRRHACHWPSCTTQVSPAMWGCRRHWYALPQPIRQRIWRAYSPGQEKSLTPSREYVEVAREARDWILANHPPPADA